MFNVGCKKTDKALDEIMVVYDSKNPLTKMLFWKRILIAIALAKIKDESVLLDIGCNTGHLLKEIQKFNTRCERWGMDIEPKILGAHIANQFQIADARHLPFIDRRFDIIFALDTLEHIKDVDDAIKEIHRVLIPNGIAVLSGPTESWFYKFCRFLQFGQFKKNAPSDKPGFRGEIDFHFYTVYELEEKFRIHGFRLVEQKSLPRMPLPTLFRVTKFERES
jgi:ubiquinone/menaquinone biosynthesis C-methylase UbiE